MTPARTGTFPASGASLLALLAGLWFFFSPWIYGAYGTANGWNGWIVGALVFLLALMRRSHPSATSLSWFNAILGIWIFISPWIVGYSGMPGRVVNSTIVGLIVFCTAVIGANSQRMSHDMTSTPT
ncbi:MAG TPA: SPW repeat protein [Bryobacteraceae bacterium]|jgi:hypothetical protein|nr:SPW repeat protein [Bryobacteraceae bacterium]